MDRKYSTRALFATITVAMLSSAFCATSLAAQQAQRKPASSTLKIVKEDLVKINANDCAACYYVIRGGVYNPSNEGISNVTISYKTWKRFTGHEDRGLVVSKSGGLVTAHIKYVPPKQTIEFTAVGDGNVPVMTDTAPDPLEAEITATWDDL